MVSNYVKLGLRLMIRNPYFTLLNILGLSTGFAVFFILWQHSDSELNSDRQWADSDRIAQLGFHWEWTDDGKTWDREVVAGVPSAVSVYLMEDYAELEAVTRIVPQSNFENDLVELESRIGVTVEEPQGSPRMFKEEKIVYADENLFDFFSIPFISGDRSKALSESNSIVLNRSQAIKYFGEASAVGKRLLVNNISFVVTGVFEDFPRNTHLDFTMAISNQAKLSAWNVYRPMPNCIIYLKGKKVMDWSKFEKNVNHPVAEQRYWAETYRAYPNGKARFVLQPVSDVAFSDWGTINNYVPKSRMLLAAFQVIGLIVLVLAVINYINLQASCTANRFKELATRKVSGALSFDFFLQFGVETMLVFFFSIALAFTWIQLSTSAFATFLQIHIEQISGRTVLIFLVVSLSSILVCTAYPTIVSRRFQPKTLLSKSLMPRWRNSFLSLAPFQYTIASLLLLCSVIVYRQIAFVLDEELGFNKDQVVIVEAPLDRSEGSDSKMDAFRDEIASAPGVMEATISSTVMGDSPSFITLRKPGIEYPVVLDSNGGVDENFIATYGLTLVAGRNFIRGEKSNTIIISEGALPRLGFQDAASALGSSIDVWSEDELGKKGEWQACEVIGILKGYRLRPFFKYGNEYDKADRGMAFTYKLSLVSSHTANKLAIRLGGTDFGNTISSVGESFARLFPGNVFHWYFLNDNVDRHYENSKVSRNQLLFFTGIAISIACLGLLGMISSKVVERTKEIGIRKVMGARLRHIASALLISPVRHMAISMVLSTPLAWYIGERYLQHFTHRVEQQWWHFALPLAIFIAIMLGTVSSVLWKAANTNPISALRCE